MKNIILIGPPGCGKGTQAELISKKYNIPHISLGSLLREKALEDSDMGRYIKDCLDHGKLVAENITSDIAKQRIAKEDCQNGYILDGYPRSVVQVKMYEDYLASKNKDLGVVIFLDITKEEALNRIVRRITCPKCGKIFANISLETTKVCDVCQKPLSKRSDDNEETFNKRFDVYQSETEPLIKYYRNKNVLYTIDGSMSEMEIFKQIEEIINN